MGAKHGYHLVDPSPWPIVGALGAFAMLLGVALWLNGKYDCFGVPGFYRPWIFGLGLVLMGYTLAGWWRDVVVESVVHGEHTPVVKLGMRFGMVLFIVAEAVFFAALFWAYFYSAIFYRDLGIASWPPPGVVTFDAWHLPLLATLILLASGTAVTWAHHAIQTGDRQGAVLGLWLTVLLGASFIGIMACEFAHAPFGLGLSGARQAPFFDPAHMSLARGVGNLNAIYGSVFFLVTGFFVLHVVIGTIFLAVCLLRAWAGQFTPERHFGFEAAAWYWHFLDVVWLFLFTGVFVLGQGG